MGTDFQIFMGVTVLRIEQQFNTSDGAFFGDFIAAAQAGKPVIPFRRPSGVTIIPVNAETGERVLPNHEKAIFEVFKPGQRPGGQLIDVPGSSAKTAPENERTMPGLF